MPGVMWVLLGIVCAVLLAKIVATAVDEPEQVDQ